MDDHKYVPIIDFDMVETLKPIYAGDGVNLMTYSKDAIPKRAYSNYLDNQKWIEKQSWIDRLLNAFRDDWDIIKDDDNIFHWIFKPVDPPHNRDRHQKGMNQTLPDARFQIATRIARWRNINIPDYV